MNLTDHDARGCTAIWTYDQERAEYGYLVRLRICAVGHDVIESTPLPEPPRPERLLPLDHGAQRSYTKTCEECAETFIARRVWARWCPPCRVAHAHGVRVAMRAAEQAARPPCKGCGVGRRDGRSIYCAACRAMPFCRKCARRVADDHRCPWALAPEERRVAQEIVLVPAGDPWPMWRRRA